MTTLILGFVLSAAGSLVIYLIGFHRGASKGSEVGCAIAKQARHELEQAQNATLDARADAAWARKEWIACATLLETLRGQ